MKHQFNLKLLSAIVTAVTISIINDVFFDVFARGSTKVRDFSFGYEFAVGLIINLAIILFLILPLSMIADNIAAKTKDLFIKTFISLALYCGVGIISGVIYSVFTFSFLTIQSQILQSP